ncbi:MAG: Sua5/YciO/YrdC/YwlC family protein [Chloroflexota bacterium]
MLKTEVRRIEDELALKKAADLILNEELIVVYFNGTYAFLCDCDAEAPADKLFQIKHRPREKSLSLVVDPAFLPDFIDLNHSSFNKHSLAALVQLQRRSHALGIVLPAGEHAPIALVQNGTILNVWTEYPPHRPLIKLTQAARLLGVRGFKGASTNLSHEPTYTTKEQVLNQFDGKVPLVLDGEGAVPRKRQKSTTLIDFTRSSPTVIRMGNVAVDEIQLICDALGLGKLEVDHNVKVL